jgi:MoxR-like ATPase
VTAAFSRETGLPLFLLEESARLDLVGAKRWFGERVIGQPEAVDLVVDLLATVKAGLTRARKPIASLLFIGPTGVGKTEMAKALAEFLFGSKQRLTRLDMSEYADPLAVQRLIGGGFASEGILTARVREQPFAVVLLDEFEKAHPLFLDLLLQMLGEGRLTDAAGRLADFSNAVVILTSNLGAESFRQGSLGFLTDGAARQDARQHFVEEVRRSVRPELFNRLDRIVAFAPLDEQTTLKIARRQLQLLEQRDGIRFRGVHLDVGREVAAHLARKGYDPRYGARPLKRAVERELLAPLADRMNGYAGDAALDVQVRTEADGLRLHVRAQVDDETGRQVVAGGAGTSGTEAVAACLDFRRDLQALRRSSSAQEVYNEIFRLEQLEKKLERQGRKSPEQLQRLARIGRLRRITEPLEALGARGYALEDEALLGFHSGRPVHEARLRTEVHELRQQWREVLLSLYCLYFPNPDQITLAVWSEHPGHLFALARAYYGIVTESGGRADVWQYRPHRLAGDPDDPILERHEVRQPAEFLNGTPEGVLGIAFGIRAAAALPRFFPEAGVHLFTDPKNQGRCLVETEDVAVALYAPPRGIERRGGVPAGPRRRSYDWAKSVVEDHWLERQFHCHERALQAILAEAIEEMLLRNLLALVER